MTIFNIKDTESINSDYLRNLYNLDSIDSTINMGYNVQSRTTSNESLSIISTEKVTVHIPAAFTEERISEILDEMSGFRLLTHKTSIDIPDDNSDLSVFNYNNYQNNAFSYYNIRNEKYEDYTQANNEKSLPNFCLGALWTRPDTNNDYTYIRAYSMFESIQELIDTNMLAGETPINNYEFDDEYIDYTSNDLENKIDYFKVMLAGPSSINPSADPIGYEESNTHVYVDFDYNINDSKQIGNVPFFNRIRLPIVNKKIPVELPTSSEYLLETDDNFPSDIVEAFTSSFMTEKLIKSFRRANSFRRSFTINGTETELRVYDLFNFVENISYGANSLSNSDELFLRNVKHKYAMENSSPFIFYFYKLILLGKIRNYVSKNTHGFEKLIVYNEDHPTEHLGFKVIKRIQGRDTPIQTFYFLNKRSLEDFIDTQVKFDRVYEYEIIGMFAVYGSNYSYENVTRVGQTSEINFDFVVRPSVKIVEVPIYNPVLRIVEPPPITPEITFYNEITSKNKLKIRLEHQDGNIVDEYMKKPLRPFSGNEEYISKLKQYFGGSTDVLVTSGKTSDGIYEIYRLEEPPDSYKDFEGALIATIQSGVVYYNGEPSRNAMFVDMIKHQKKYYYAFRVLTHRGNPSELSKIYVVEMYEDADETFLTFDLYQEPEIKDSQNIYNMRKYIQIIPNFDQTIINEEELLNKPSATDATGIVKLGPKDEEGENLWDYKDENKYIKLRLESKSSGRKMDINLYFKIKTPTN